MENKKKGLVWTVYKVIADELGQEIKNSRISLNYDVHITPSGANVYAGADAEICSCLDLLAAIVYILEDCGFFAKGNEHWAAVLKELIVATRTAYELESDSNGYVN